MNATVMEITFAKYLSFLLLAPSICQLVFSCPSLNISMETIVANKKLLEFSEDIKPTTLLSIEGLNKLIKNITPHLCILNKYASKSEILNGSFDQDSDFHASLGHGRHNYIHVQEKLSSNVKNAKRGNEEQEVAKHTQLERSSDIGDHHYISELQSCSVVKDLLLGIEPSATISPEKFILSFCPSLIDRLLNFPCKDMQSESSIIEKPPGIHEHIHDHNHDHHSAVDHVGRMTKDAWIAAIVSLILIGVIALLCIMLIPSLKKSKYYGFINHFLLSLAVGSLAGDALIHLLSHAMTMDVDSALDKHLIHGLYGFTAFIGILVFYVMERLHNILGGDPSHSGQSTLVQNQEDEEELANRMENVTPKRHEHNSSFFEGKREKVPLQPLNSSHSQQNLNASQERQTNCFENCPPLSHCLEDTNGNNDHGNILCRSISHPLAVQESNLPECEKLVSFSCDTDKGERQVLPKARVIPIAPPPLVQQSPPLSLIRQDSKNFNMVLQEYHVGHHGHSHHGHSHVTGKKDSLRTMILLGDGMHTFIDGVAMGAAFGSSLTGGIATAIAVMCHELPHKVGDFAILFEMGMKKRQAIKMALVLWFLSFLGLIFGVFIGSIKVMSPWIYSFTAGVFLYLALVDLLSELSITESRPCAASSQVLLQLSGMLLGAGIMLVIAVYEHDLQHMLESMF